MWFLPEARVGEWLEREDGLREEDRRFYETQDGFWNRPSSLPEQYWGTRLGGVPTWVQEPQLETLRFLAQIVGGYAFNGPLPSPDEVGCPVERGTHPVDFAHRQPSARRFDGPRSICEISPAQANRRKQIREGDWACAGPMLGDCGIGYILCEDQGPAPPQCKFLWQGS